MKSNLIVITVAAALITTTVKIIQPPYNYCPPHHPLCVMLSKLDKLDLNNPNQCLFVSFCQLQIGLGWKVRQWGSWSGGSLQSGLLLQITSGCLNSIHFWCKCSENCMELFYKLFFWFQLPHFLTSRVTIDFTCRETNVLSLCIIHLYINRNRDVPLKMKMNQPGWNIDFFFFFKFFYSNMCSVTAET